MALLLLLLLVLLLLLHGLLLLLLPQTGLMHHLLLLLLLLLRHSLASPGRHLRNGCISSGRTCHIAVGCYSIRYVSQDLVLQYGLDLRDHRGFLVD